MILAIDFDGTIVDHRYPEIGEEKLFAFDTLKELQKQDHKLILWTYRSGKELDDAVEYCKKNGLVFYAVNTNRPTEEFDSEKTSRKIYADVYIDDRNVGGFLGWSEIWKILNPDFDDSQRQNIQKLRKQSFVSKLKRIFK